MRIGILTSGGDCPGINATIRGVCKTAINHYGMEVIGIHSGFQGLLTKDIEPFTDKSLSGLLNQGGTMLGTSREKPFKKGGVVSDVDKPALILQNIKEMGLDEKTYKPGVVQARISNAKNHLVTPTGYAANKEAYEGDMAAKMPAIRDIYTRYWERCRQAGAMDFDDLLVYTYILFRDFPDVLARYRDQFRYVLVDEYQDTNYAQHSIVLQLTKENQRVCVVGDDAQSIYSFRGADIDNILYFRVNIYHYWCVD